MNRLILSVCLVLVFCLSAFGQGAPPQIPTHVWIQSVGKLFTVASKYPGVNVNDASSDQAGMTALLSDTTEKNIYMPPGDYIMPSSFNNSVSDRTFIWDAGARVVGVLHLAIGATSADTVRNVRSFGVPVVTERVGTYNCQNVYADGFIIGDSVGGGRGAHFYKGTRDLHIGYLYIRRTPGNIYALGIDLDSTGLQYEPNNITLDEVIIEDADSSAVRFASTRNVTIGKLTIRGYNYLDCIKLYSTNWTHFGIVIIEGTPSAVGGFYGMSIELDTGSTFDEVRIGVDSVTNGGILVTNSVGTHFGKVYLTSTDTVGTKYGFNVNASSDVTADYVYAFKFKQGIRNTSNTNVRFDDMIVDSCTVGYTGSGVSGFKFSSIQYRGCTDTTSGTPPSLTTGVAGPLPGVSSTLPAITIAGTAHQGYLPGDTTQPQDAVSGYLDLVPTTSLNAGSGGGVRFGYYSGTTKRIFAEIKGGIYSSADSGLGNISIINRRTSTDSTLRPHTTFWYNRDILVGDTFTGTWLRLYTRGTAGQVLKYNANGVVTPANDSVGTGGGSGDIEGVTAGVNAYGGGTSDTVIIGGDTLKYRVRDSLTVGTGTQVYDGDIRADAMRANIIRPLNGSAIENRSIDSCFWTDANGDCVFSIKSDDTATYISSCSKPILSINQPSLLAIDSAGIGELYIDTNGFHMVRLPRTPPPGAGYGLEYVFVASDVDSFAYVLLSAGGAATRLGADSGNGATALDDTVVFVDGIGTFVNHENAGDTSTVQVDADTVTTLSTKANVTAGLATKNFTKQWVDTTGAAGNAGLHQIASDTIIDRENPTGGLKINFKDSSGGPDIRTWGIETNAVTTGMITNQTLTELDLDSTNAHFSVSSFHFDTLRSNKTSPAPIYIQDSISQFGKSYMDTIAMGAHAWYHGRTKGTTGQVRAYREQSGTDSTEWITPFGASDAATLIEDSLDEYPSPGFLGDMSYLGMPTLIPYGTAVQWDSSWNVSFWATRGTTNLAVYQADTATVFYQLDSNLNDASDTIVHRYWYEVPTDMFCDSVIITYIAGDSAIQIDSIRVIGDTTNASSVKVVSHVMVTSATNLEATSKTRTAVAMTSNNSWRVFRGGRVELLVWVTTTNATGANKMFGFISPPQLALRYRN